MGSKPWPKKNPVLYQRGMSMIELLIAMAVLAVGMGGMVAVFAAAIAGNGKAKFDTSGTMLAQSVLERIAAQPANAANNITLQDCNAGAPQNWTVSSAPGGAGLTATGDIDWVGQTYAQAQAASPNHAMLFVACGNNGQQVTFDVRWNIQAISANTRIITVSARPAAASNAGMPKFTQPVTLRGIGGV
jgi:type IV pilus modification protein PilV